MVMIMSLLKNQKNWKAKKRLSPKNRLSQEKIHQKVGIHLISALRRSDSLLTLSAKENFNSLRLAFIKALILQHFDPKCHIWIKINVSGYIICGMLSQLASRTSLNGVVTKTSLRQWYPEVFFLRKMIPAETQYETHDVELLAVVKAFKTWRHYLEGCKHEVFVLMDHNNPR